MSIQISQKVKHLWRWVRKLSYVSALGVESNVVQTHIIIMRQAKVTCSLAEHGHDKSNSNLVLNYYSHAMVERT